MREYTDEQIEAGRRLFSAQARFVRGAVNLKGAPAADRPEVAFAGRSNVGKSSLINALCHRKNLARASNTPGRTQEMNFFDLGEGRVYLVDLPGYGFADAPRQSVEAWQAFSLDYLRGRTNLRRAFVLIDARRGIGEVDKNILKQFDAAAVAYQIVLTKVDKIRAGEIDPLLAATQAALKKHAAAHPDVIATSSEKGDGLALLRAEIADLTGSASAAHR